MIQARVIEQSIRATAVTYCEADMSRAIAERYQRWLDYERDAHAKVIRSLESVPTERRTSPVFRRAVTLLAHIAAARRVWLYRMGKIAEAPSAFFPENVELAEVAAELHGIEERWAETLRGMDDEQLGRGFEYQSLDAGRFRNRIEDILTQLFGHSWYHRGQIAMLVRTVGGEPAATDLVYWCREPVR
jgi:uncharacterized damage-inducible protein DinB